MRSIQIGSGLSSHGGALGVVVALLWWCRRRGLRFYPYIDAVIIGAVWLFPWVRIGNLFNSEIYGRETDVAWAFIFEQSRSAGDVPRHPTQIYEALAGFILIGISLFLEKRREQLKDGFLLYVLLFFYFSGRFSIEFFKEYQTLTPDVPFTMGQWLSLPVVLLTAIMAYRLRGTPPPRPKLEVAPAGPKPRPASVRSVRKKGQKKKRR
jgi:prolipoprotein diacylglyceryltransferase